MFKSEFRFEFRPYQKRILDYFDHHLSDHKLHVVAPPGSGKTILGLEAVRRLNRPTLILAPTLTIRNQWLDRYLEFFLNRKRAPAWISLDITKPKFLNIITYQSLLSESRKEAADESVPEEEPEDAGTDAKAEKSRKPARIIQLLRQANIEVLVLDEAHHLRKEWWSALNRIEKEIKPRIVALTATPPYDVSVQEWERYEALCGPVDAEIYVPELVREKNLCPHQDYVWFSRPRVDEQVALTEFRENVNHFVEALKQDADLTELLKSHPHIMEPEQNLDGILSDPASFSAKLIYLRAAGVSVDHLFEHLGVAGETLPPLDFHWLEILLRDVLFVHGKALKTELEKSRREIREMKAEAKTRKQAHAKARAKARKNQAMVGRGAAAESPPDQAELERLEAERLEKERLEEEKLRETRARQEQMEKDSRILARIGREARRIGVVDHSRIRLSNPELVSRILSRSLSKVESVEKIAALETESLGDELRMVILADFIRRMELPSGPEAENEPTKMGVVPLFETLRRAGRYPSMAVLTGSLIIVPKNSITALKRRARALGLAADVVLPRKLSFTEEFQRLEVTAGRRQKLVRLITDVFTEGDIKILIGTTALLGEGWDAPAMNSIVLASSVSTFMLSNQLRGRAIRTREGHPEKTANIWHLVCLEDGGRYAGPDFAALHRRFRGFMGPALDEPRIENGLERLGIIAQDIAFIDLVNEHMREHALNRAALRERWNDCLEGDELEHQVELRLKTQPAFLPRTFSIFQSITGLITRGAWLFAAIILAGGELARTAIMTANFSKAILILIGACLVGFAYTWRDFWKAAKLFMRHGPIDSSAREVGFALLEALRDAGYIRTPARRIRLVLDRLPDESLVLSAKGLRMEEQAVYFQALDEMLSTIDNPRYILVRHSRLATIRRRDYHAVPEVLAGRKEDAELLARHWEDHVGPADLHFTRKPEGRRLLLEARLHSLAAGLEDSEQMSVWT